jgi:glutamate--cysteine ligase
VDRFVVGGFYRVHGERGRDQNLNAPGMHFVPLKMAADQVQPVPFPNPCNTPDCGAAGEPNRFYSYGVVARLALLAASYELEQTDPER